MPLLNVIFKPKPTLFYEVVHVALQAAVVDAGKQQAMSTVEGNPAREVDCGDTAKSSAEVHTKYKTYAAADVHSIVLDASELALLEPNLRSGLVGGLLVPEDAVIYPTTDASSFLQEAVRGGQYCYRDMLRPALETAQFC